MYPFDTQVTYFRKFMIDLLHINFLILYTRIEPDTRYWISGQFFMPDIRAMRNIWQITGYPAK